MITKKLILTSFAIFIFINAFAQILPPVNVWTPGGGNIFFNGGNVGIGLNNPQYSLHINGDAVISKSIGAHAITSTTLRTDTLTSGAISAQTIQVGGRGSFLGGIYAPSIKITGFAGVNDRQVIVDTGGNLRVGPGISYPGAACTPGAPSWVFGGNSPSNTNFPDPRIGTCDMSDFVLMAHSVSSIYIKPSGFVGIGSNNNNPLAQLDVISTNGKAFRIHHIDQADNDYEIFNVNSDGSTSIFDLDPNLLNPILTMTHSNGTTLKFMANGTGDISSSGALRPHFASKDFTVYEGIPGYGKLRLQINSAATVGGAGNGTITLRSLDVNANNDALTIVNNNQNDGSGTDMVLLSVKNNGNTTMTAPANSTSPVLTLNNSNPSFSKALVVRNPANTLDVYRIYNDGTVWATEVNVALTNLFPDYVFSEGYKRMAWQELEQYLKTNKHLPGIPSAAEVQKNGMALGEMERIHIEKTEELYLYLIELSKKMDALSQKNGELQKEIENLKK